jgi:hypothetical protein
MPDLSGFKDVGRDWMVKTPKVQGQHDHAAALVKSFFASASSAFAPLVSSPRAKWSVHLAHSTADGISDVSPDAITGFFFATATFANVNVAGDLTFGDREYLVNTVLGPASSSARYGLWEWADALEQPHLVPRETAFVMDAERLSNIVTAMANAVLVLEAPIAAPSQTTIARIEQARSVLQEQFRARLREDDHRRASAEAGEAFRVRDYRRVVKLLEAVEGLLTPAERDKLAYARRHL